MVGAVRGVAGLRAARRRRNLEGAGLHRLEQRLERALIEPSSCPRPPVLRSLERGDVVGRGRPAG